MSELKAYCPYVNRDGFYHKSDVDALIAEKDAEIAKLKARIQLDDDEMEGFLDLEEECGGGDLRNYIAELKQKLDKAIAERDGNQVCIDALNEKLGAVNEFIKASKELLKESQKMHQRRCGLHLPARNT